MPSAEPVVLRQVVDTDLASFFAHQQDREAARVAAVPPREADAFAEHWRTVLADPAIFVRTVVVGGEVAGHVVCFPRDGRDEVGYWLGREHWGRGLATAALRQQLAAVA